MVQNNERNIPFYTIGINNFYETLNKRKTAFFINNR